jgi:antitoxin component YwqK of YwqJK toxin-antitoxin module
MFLWLFGAAGCSREGTNQRAPLQTRASDAEAAGLTGRVKTVRIEKATFSKKGGRWFEVPRQFVSTTRYNEKGDMTEEAFYQPNGLLAVRVVYTYDPQGRHAEEAAFRGEASRPSRLVYHHDESGQLIEKVVYNADGTFDWKVHYTYDGQGNKKEVAVFPADGSLSTKRVYLYDGDGNEIEEAVYSGNALVSKGVFSYDEKGNRTQETFSLPKGTVSARYVYAYAFDESGNWIKRTRSGINLGSGEVDFEHSDSTYRTISYY